MKRLARLLAMSVFVVACLPNAQAQPKLDDQAKSLIEQIRKKANLKLSPITQQSAIDSAAAELQRISRPTISASIAEGGANALAAQQLKKDGSKFSTPRFTFAGQSASVTMDYVGSISVPVAGAADVGAQLHAQLATAVELAADQPAAEFRIRLAVTSLEVTSLKLTRNGQPLPSVANEIVDALISGLLVPAQGLLNRVELRIPTIIAAKIDIRPTKNDQVSINLDPKTLRPKLQIVAASFLLDRGRLTIVAQDAGTPNNVPVKPHNLGFETFRGEFLKALNGTGATWINEGQFSAFVETNIIDRLASKMLSTGPVCVQAKIIDLPLPIHEKLRLPPETSIECAPEKDCRQTMDCAQHDECRACLLRSPFGNCIQSGNDPLCEARKVANKAGCEADKERRRIQCEGEKVVNKGSCEALKEAYKRIRGTGPEYANVDSSDLRLNGGARICLNDIKLDGKTLRLTGKLQVEGATSANGKITFTPLNVVGHVMCFAPFDYQISDTAKVAPQNLEVDTLARLQTETTLVGIDARISNPIHLRLPFTAIATKLASNPRFQITCPIPGVATKIRALTPDSWWPKVARGDIDKDLPGLSFNLDLFSKPIEVGGVLLSGRLQRSERGIGGVFFTARAGRSH